MDAVDDGAVRTMNVDLAAYARALEKELAVFKRALADPASAGQAKAAKTARRPVDELKEVETIRRAAQNGITRQMGWKPTCRGKWCYDGVCPDPEVFGVLLGLGGPPDFTLKKFKADEFMKLIGRLENPVRCAYTSVVLARRNTRLNAHALWATSCYLGRYATLYVTSSEIAMRRSNTGEFSFSGTYGKLQ
ncbi:hypothetical protein BD413DRAFT_609948 [Trametes elegans]|nr:hypothetical protein BD413DRAFT_609948 [Trametes elegans]